MKNGRVGLVILAVTLLFALSTGFGLFYRLAYILVVGLAGGYVWTWLSLRWLEAEVKRRSLVASVGDRLEERITVRNRGPFATFWLEAQDLSDLPNFESGRAIGLGPRGFRSWKANYLCQRRGSFTLGPLRVVSEDPLGLFRRQRYFGQTQEITIYPAVVDLPGFSLPAGDLTGEGPLRQRVYRQTPQASGVREYMHGDSYNRIHWPTTARLGKIMVKELDLGISSNVWLLLDLHEDVQAGWGIEGTEEYGVTIAASIARKYLALGFPVGVIGYGRENCVVLPDRGHVQFRNIMDTLAAVQAQGGTPVEEVLAIEETRFNRYTTLVIITPSPNERWVREIQELLRRGAKVCVILLDASSFDGGRDPAHILGRLAVRRVPTYLIRQGDDISEVLAQKLESREASYIAWAMRQAQI